MKTEDKELLLRDLCARLPYGVKLHCISNTITCISPYTLDTIVLDRFCNKNTEYVPLDEVKPYLFPLSSMSREQLNDFYANIRPVIEESFEEYDNDKTDYEGERPITMKTIKCDVVAVNWMLKNHFDINGLLLMDLAIDATGLNIYKEETK